MNKVTLEHEGELQEKYKYTTAIMDKVTLEHEGEQKEKYKIIQAGWQE